MSFETRATNAAEGLRAATRVDPEAGLDRLRRTHRRRTAGRVVAAGVAVAVVLLAVGRGLTGDWDSAGPSPAGRPSSTASPSPLEPIDTTGWTRYTSEQYGFEVGHPPDWSEVPATRQWSFGKDVRRWDGPAYDAFVSRDGEVMVSVWKVPLDRGTEFKTTDDLVPWVGDYCKSAVSRPCSGIGERAVDLCLEARDCHPGVLVRFDLEVQAFFSGGIYGDGAMIIVSIWRPEGSSTVSEYGGSQRLLEAFLSTMAVWPASTAFAERECYGGPAALNCETALHRPKRQVSGRG